MKKIVDKETLGALRSKYGLTLREAASLIGMPVSSYEKMEYGINKVLYAAYELMRLKLEGKKSDE